jgi:hypothetical protein
MRAAVLLCLASGCVEYNQSRLHGIDIYSQDPPEKIDVLMVVDNSASMGPYQARLGENYGAFISWFIQGDVDYRIAVTTTDDGNDPAVPDPARGRFVGPIITTDMDADQAAEAFAANVNVGTNGSGLEVGLKTAWMALDQASRDPRRAFLRDDADLSIVFVSDEEDSSPWPVNDYINAFFQIKGERSHFNASALTVTDPSTCTEDGARFSSAGTRYVDVAVETHGLTANLCDSDFSHIVNDLSLASTRLTDRYFLTAEPDVGSLAVSIEDNGVEADIPCDLGWWTYQRLEQDGVEQPVIVFDRDHVPPAGSRIAIRYLYGSGREAFCGGES